MALSKSIRRADVHKTHGRGAGGGEQELSQSSGVVTT